MQLTPLNTYSKDIQDILKKMLSHYECSRYSTEQALALWKDIDVNSEKIAWKL